MYEGNVVGSVGHGVRNPVYKNEKIYMGTDI